MKCVFGPTILWFPHFVIIINTLTEVLAVMTFV